MILKKYKGYVAEADIDVENSNLHGNVLGIEDVVTFQGKTVEELVQAFHDSVAEYLKFCAEMGRKPEKPKSGHVAVRMPPALHRVLFTIAKQRGFSFNRLVVDCLEREAKEQRELVR